ncbi:hypothetical protein PGB90_001238 [Kerria lacca]
MRNCSRFFAFGAGTFIAYIFFCEHLTSSAADISTGDCPVDKLITYKVVLHTFWTSSRFPKHYPQWRPPAQWSMLIDILKNYEKE